MYYCTLTIKLTRVHYTATLPWSSTDYFRYTVLSYTQVGKSKHTLTPSYSYCIVPHYRYVQVRVYGRAGECKQSNHSNQVTCLWYDTTAVGRRGLQQWLQQFTLTLWSSACQHIPNHSLQAHETSPTGQPTTHSLYTQVINTLRWSRQEWQQLSGESVCVHANTNHV